MRIWLGQTPDGYSLVIERDERGQWVATVAGVSRSRSGSLETALLEAAGSSAPREWAERLAAAIVARSADDFRTSASYRSAWRSDRRKELR
jgi:hypothetical protein